MGIPDDKLPADSSGAEEAAHWAQLVEELRIAGDFRPSSLAWRTVARSPRFWARRVVGSAALAVGTGVLMGLLGIGGAGLGEVVALAATLVGLPTWCILTMGAALDQFTGDGPMEEGAQWARWGVPVGRGLCAFALLYALGVVLGAGLVVASSSSVALLGLVAFPMLFWTWWFVASELVLLRRDLPGALREGTLEALWVALRVPCWFARWVFTFEGRWWFSRPPPGERQLPAAAAQIVVAPAVGWMASVLLVGPVLFLLQVLSSLAGISLPAGPSMDLVLLPAAATGCSLFLHVAIFGWTYQAMAAVVDRRVAALEAAAEAPPEGEDVAA